LPSITQRLAREIGQGVTESKAFTLTSPEAYGLFAGVPVRSGVTVTSSTALRVPAVAAAIGFISESCAIMPFKPHDEVSKEVLRQHPAFKIVRKRSNPWTSAGKLRGQLTRDALLCGHGFAQVVRNGEGKPLELHRLDPAAVSVETDDYDEPSYRIRLKGGGDTVLPYTDVLHISTLDGVSPITHAKEAIGLALAAEQHLANWFGRAGRPSGYLATTEKVSGDKGTAELEKMIKRWNDVHAGENSGRTAILDRGFQYYPLSTSNTDAEFYNNRIEQIREIARAFRIPVTMLWELSHGTMANTEQLALQFMQWSIKPWLDRWKDAYAQVLLSPEDSDEIEIEYEPKVMLSVDFAAQATAYSQFVAMRAYTPNDVRSGMNMPPLPGGNDLINPFTTSDGGATAPEPQANETEE